MANRDALRELQGRLAQRLQAVREEGVQAAWLAVEAGGRAWLLPLAQSGEIFTFQAPQPVPYTQPWFLGVANLRGGLWGTVDLAAFIDNHPPAHRGDAARAEARLVTLGHALELNCALLIDRLAGLRAPEAFVASSAPADGAPDWFGSRYTDAQGRTWQELDLQALARQAPFLHISA